MQRTEGYRNFCNKLWNAARYVLMNTEGQDNGVDCAECSYSPADLWILSRLNRTIAETSSAIDSYRFDLAAQAIYEFTWNEYCDWYLELAKISLQSDDALLQRGTRQTLLRVLETVLRLAHPIMPFITEEIWQRVGPLAGVTAATIMLQPYPASDASAIDAAAETQVKWAMDFILGIRRIRGEMNIAPGKPLNVLLQNGSANDQANLKQLESYLLKLGRLESITWLNAGDDAPESAIALVGDMKILIPMAGLIDKDAELARLDKEIQRIEKSCRASKASSAMPPSSTKLRPTLSPRNGKNWPGYSRRWPICRNSTPKSKPCKPMGGSQKAPETLEDWTELLRAQEMPIFSNTAHNIYAALDDRKKGRWNWRR